MCLNDYVLDGDVLGVAPLPVTCPMPRDCRDGGVL